MKSPFFWRVLRSTYCLLVFIAALGVGYVLIPPNAIHQGYDLTIGIFVVLFALTITCMVRTIKERIRNSSHKGSVLGLISSVVGLTALQVCGIGGPMCGASVGMGVVSVFLPGYVIHTLRLYTHELLILSVMMQLASLHYMRCLYRKSAY